MICFKKSKMKKLVAVIKLIAAEHPYTAKLSKPTKQLNIINPQPETVQKYKLKVTESRATECYQKLEILEDIIIFQKIVYNFTKLKFHILKSLMSSFNLRGLVLKITHM